MPLLLTKEDVVRVLDMRDCMNVVEKAFAELASGTAVLPLRIGISPPDGVSLYMPAYLKQMGALACKVVTVYKNNPTRHNLPTTIGKVLLQDPATGEVTCIMDGGYLTAVRTGAVSGVATKYLARTDKGQVAGIVGAGVQAKMQLWAMATSQRTVTGVRLRRVRRRFVGVHPGDERQAGTRDPARRFAGADTGCSRYRLYGIIVLNPVIRWLPGEARNAHQRHRKSLAERARIGYGHYPALQGGRRFGGSVFERGG